MNVGDGTDRAGGGRSVADLLGLPVTEAASLTPPPAQGSGSRLPRSVTGGVDQGAHPGLVVALLSAITVAGLLLRLPSFRDSLNGDEVSTYFIVVGHSLGEVLLLVHSNQETTPPLYFVLAWFTKGLLGNQAQSIRLVSLVAGTAAIPLTFLLGRLTVGRRAGLVGATCVALSPYMIFYSTQARPYMLVLFLALLSTLALLRALDTGRVTWWVTYAACSCAAAYTHYTVVFILIVQLVWALWTRPQARQALVVVNVAVGVAYLPWLGGLREDLHAPNFIGALTPVNPATIRDINENFWIGHPITPIGSLPGSFTVALAGAGLVLAVIGLAIKARGTRVRLSPGTVLVFLLALAPATLIVLYSWARVDILGGGSQISSWPAMALAIGTLVIRPPNPWRWAAIALTLTAYAIGGLMMIGPSAHRTDTDAAVAYIDRVGTSGDPIVDSPYFANPLSELDVSLATAGQSEHHAVLRLGAPSVAVMESPLSGPHPQPVFHGLPITPPQVVASQAVALARHGTIFLVSPSGPVPVLLRYFPNNPISLFYKALPADFHVVGHMTFPGYSNSLPVSVYVFHDAAPR